MGEARKGFAFFHVVNENYKLILSGAIMKSQIQKGAPIMKHEYSTEKIEKMVSDYVEAEKEPSISIEDILREAGLDPKKVSIRTKPYDKKSSLLTAISNPQFIKVVEFVVKSNRCNTGELQRKFNIGYGKAATYIDAMEALNLVSKFRLVSDDELPAPREILPRAKEFLECYK